MWTGFSYTVDEFTSGKFVRLGFMGRGSLVRPTLSSKYVL